MPRIWIIIILAVLGALVSGFSSVWQQVRLEALVSRSIIGAVVGGALEDPLDLVGAEGGVGTEHEADGAGDEGGGEGGSGLPIHIVDMACTCKGIYSDNIKPWCTDIHS